MASPVKRKREEKKLRVGIVGATGMVGQRFITLLSDHPMFDITVLAASANSAGKTYAEVMEKRWQLNTDNNNEGGNRKGFSDKIGKMVVMDASEVEEVAKQCDFIFCAVDMDKHAVLTLEENYARTETPVVSNNSAARSIPDVPMVVPEINPQHNKIIPAQRKRLGTKHGFIAVKPNCSLQSYVPALHPLLDLGLSQVLVTTFQAVSGAGKTVSGWPEMQDNVIPFIGGEEQKSEQEPLKIWGTLDETGNSIASATSPVISAQCIRVPVSDGHLCAVSMAFEKKVSREEILARWKDFPSLTDLPSAPSPFLTYFEEDNRPQTKLDRDIHNGMGISIGRLREDKVLGWKFVALSHNTLRGAAGGAVLTAELLVKQGYITHKSDRQ